MDPALYWPPVGLGMNRRQIAVGYRSLDRLRPMTLAKRYRSTSCWVSIRQTAMRQEEQSHWSDLASSVQGTKCRSVGSVLLHFARATQPTRRRDDQHGGQVAPRRHTSSSDSHQAVFKSL
jgi:hypothetical protein